VGLIGYPDAPRYAQALYKLTGDDEIAPPGLTLETDRPEYSLLKRERFWTLHLNLAALAANFNKFLIQPTIGSNTITVLTHIYTDQVSHVSIAEAVVAGGAASFAIVRDGRAVGLPSIPRRCQTAGFTAQGAALTGSLGLIAVQANVLVALPPFITAPDNTKFAAILVQSTAVNVTQNVYLAGYERSARPEEVAEL
jgi:hypothetical protein